MKTNTEWPTPAFPCARPTQEPRAQIAHPDPALPVSRSGDHQRSRNVIHDLPERSAVPKPCDPNARWTSDLHSRCRDDGFDVWLREVLLDTYKLDVSQPAGPLPEQLLDWSANES
jgi:hypothetical protein